MLEESLLLDVLTCVSGLRGDESATEHVRRRDETWQQLGITAPFRSSR